jgi:hypothetical protein
MTAIIFEKAFYRYFACIKYMIMKTTKWVLLAVLMATTGCGATKMTTSWTAENLAPKAYKKILVLALDNGPNLTTREKMEEHVVGDLKDLGYTAVCSCDEFSPKAFEKMNEKQALDKLGSSGVDAVLTIVLLDKVKERYYAQGKDQFAPNYMYPNQFWEYYNNIHGRIFTPGYYVEDTKYFWESNFYELTSKNLIYTAKSESFSSSSTSVMAHEYGKMIIKNMIKKHVLKDGKDK